MTSETFLLPIYRCLDIPLGLSYRTGRTAVQVIFATILHRNKYVIHEWGGGPSDLLTGQLRDTNSPSRGAQDDDVRVLSVRSRPDQPQTKRRTVSKPILILWMFRRLTNHRSDSRIGCIWKLQRN